MEHKEYFESFGDFLDFVRVPVDPRFSHKKSHVRGEANFRGTSTFEEALKLAVNGWEEGTTLLEKYSSQFTSTLGSLLQIDDYFYDVSGQDFDLDRVLIGEPEAWLNSEPVQVKAPALHTLKLVVNFGSSSQVDKNVIILRGAAIAALVNLLEKSRRRVEIELVNRVAVNGQSSNETSAFASCNIGCVRILAKKAGDDLDISKLAFMLAHPSMLRRFGAAAKENYSNRTIANQICAGDRYGYSIEVLPEDRGDIYAPRMYGNTWNEEEAKRWIVEELKKQGVELKEGA